MLCDRFMHFLCIELLLISYEYIAILHPLCWAVTRFPVF